MNQILSFLAAGGVIGFPTDTAYGLGADASNEAAVRRVFQIKGRPETKPVLVIVDSLEMVTQIAELTESAKTLAARLWPGPLTLVLPAHPSVSRLLTAHTDAIGVRWPNAAFAVKLVGKFGKPLTATSANPSGIPAAITAEDVRNQLAGKLEIVIDGGKLPWPGGSTILDFSSEPPLLVREGPVSFDTLSRLLKGNIRR